MRIGIIGGGRAARVLAHNFVRAGHPVIGFALRDASMSTLPGELQVPRLSVEELAQTADLLLLAVSDSALPEMASRCSALAAGETYLFHLSGAHASTLFARPRSFALHPLRALRGADDNLEGALFVFDGDAESEQLARELVSGWGGTFATIDPDAKPKYHAAAVFASNFIAVLLDRSETLMLDAGVEVQPAHLADLASSAIINWRENAGTSRFTGPIVRGDTGVVESHLEALAGRPEVLELYAALSSQLVATLMASSPERVDLKEIEQLLEGLHVS